MSKHHMVSPTKFSYYVIYHKPVDIKNVEYVVREWEITREGLLPGNSVTFHSTLESARKSLITMGLIRVERHKSDAPVIVETWI